MKPAFLILPLCAIFAWHCRAGDPAPTGNAPPEKMEMMAWRFSPQFFITHNRDGNISDWIKAAVVALPDHPLLDNTFVAGFFQSQGIQFPEGTDSVYDSNSGFLIVRSSRQTLVAIDNFNKSFGSAAVMADFDLSIFEVTLPPGRNPLSARMTYADLENLPARSVKLLDRVSTSATSGDVALANHFIHSPGAPVEGKNAGGMDAFAPGESGTVMETELVVENDFKGEIDANINFRFRKLPSKSDGTAADVQLTTSMRSLQNVPVILSVTALPGDGGKAIVAVGRVHGFRPDPASRVLEAADDSPKKPVGH